MAETSVPEAREAGPRRVGRPSVVAERRRQILDAVEECVVTYGLTGTTLDRIADTAGLTRSNLAHFVGNRDEIIEAALERSVTRFTELMQAEVADLPREDQLRAFLDSGFAGSERVRRATRLMNELSAAAVHNAHARAVLRPALERADSWIGDMVEARYPQASSEIRDSVATLLPLVLRELDRDRLLDGVFGTDDYTRRVATGVEVVLDALGP
jgi:AcrR family transcriptional regulator